MTASVIAVVGPTTTGKSQLAIELARALDGEVVNADSMQLYQAREETVKATNRFVRCQESWFRRDPRITWLDAQEEGVLSRAIALADGPLSTFPPSRSCCGLTNDTREAFRWRRTSG